MSSEEDSVREVREAGHHGLQYLSPEEDSVREVREAGHHGLQSSAEGNAEGSASNNAEETLGKGSTSYFPGGHLISLTRPKSYDAAASGQPSDLSDLRPSRLLLESYSTDALHPSMQADARPAHLADLQLLLRQQGFLPADGNTPTDLLALKVPPPAEGPLVTMAKVRWGRGLPCPSPR